MADPSDFAAHAAAIRTMLLRLPPSGATGCEGLIASVIASITGTTIRLAKSGSQFGRDASSPVGSFSLAVEVKRYDAPLRLDDLLGKAASASDALGADTDLWIIAATSEIGDDIVRKVTSAVERSGISVLFLDWTSRPLPPLSVALATKSDVTLAWFSEHHPAIDQNELKQGLESIRNSDAFQPAESFLLGSLSAAQVGLHALREENESWLRRHWSDEILSQQDFEQIIVPLDANRAILSGRAERIRLTDREAWRAAVTVLLGDEGVGKTWLIADWWLSAATRPILIPVLGRSVDLLDSRDPLGSLASILRLQYTNVDIDGWRRRLNRWSRRESTEEPWLVVVLDGLNERSDLPWANLLNAFWRALTDAGGALIVTCRPGFWRREVAPRLSGAVRFEEILLSEYTPVEVNQLLIRHGQDPELLSQQLKEFLRNARVCAVALNLLKKLAAHSGELTLERLQLEYWRQRMRERGNGIQHTAQDFHNILRAHAKEWLEDPSRQFLLDDLPSKSTLAARNPAAIARDLADIVEGRFMHTSADDENSYEFRAEALPFALGLLLNHELRALKTEDSGTFAHLIDAWAEPIRGFSATSKIIGAAFSLACLDPDFPRTGKMSLLKYWASLQNLDEEAVDAMAPNVLLQPAVFCDVLEEMHGSGQHFTHEHVLERMLFRQTFDPRVHESLDITIPRWLNRWCRKSLPFGGQAAKEALDRDAVEQKLRLLSQSEREKFDLLCTEITDPGSAHADELAVFQMIYSPLAQRSKAIWAWCLAQTVGRDYRSAWDSMQWAVVLNPVDWKATAAAIRSLVDPVDRESSEPYRRAAANALRLLGDRDSAQRAETLIGPLPKGETWRAVTRFCEANPHDPRVSVCKNLPVALQTLMGISGVAVRTARFSHQEDADLSMVTPALARFAIDPLVRKIREIVTSIDVREGASRQALCWEMDEYSPVLDEPTVSSIKRALVRFIKETKEWTIDEQVIANAMLRTIFPHLCAQEQLTILLGLPTEVIMFLSLHGTLKQPDVRVFEAAFDEAVRSSNAVAVERILFLASAERIEFTSRSRDLLKAALKSPRSTTRNIAFDVIRRSEDRELNEFILIEARGAAFDGEKENDFYPTEAIARAVIKSGRVDNIALVSPNRRQATAAQMDEDAVIRVMEDIDTSLRRLLQPISDACSFQFSVTTNATSDGFMQRLSISSEEDEEGFLALTDLEASARRSNQTQQRRRQEYLEATRALKRENATALQEVPSRRYIARVVDLAPERVIEWLNWILGNTDRRILSQLLHFGSALAGACARADGGLAARVLSHLEDIESPYRIFVDSEDIPLYLSAVFSESDSPEMDSLRESTIASATNDARLELCARAATICGAHSWLLKYIEKHYRNEHPGIQARAITLAGFCSANDDVSYVFSGEMPTGFLADVVQHSLKEHTRANWAQYWCLAAIRAESKIDFWRFTRLAEGVVDRRYIQCFDGLPEDWPYRPFLSELLQRLDKAAKERSDKRERTLFGMRAPSDEILWAMRERRAISLPSA